MLSEVTGSRPGLDLAPGTLTVLVGPSLVGKSTFAVRQFPPTWRICLDVLRGAVADDEADQSATTVAAAVQDLLLDERLARGLRTVIDSTALLPHVRTKLLARARYYRRPTLALLFNQVSLEECQRRNAIRPRKVPPDILRWQHTLIPTAQELRAEGFDQVLTVAADATVHAAAPEAVAR
ncbi:AAA family ATPase [Streptomyces klenkii]|uniref:AAA family ATPase n=1 Tax=Streptomyces klenkii TaxID=1420899 RepID=UPI001319E494|nr:AAA family ATPase [Streptomyces klenkii]